MSDSNEFTLIARVKDSKQQQYRERMVSAILNDDLNTVKSIILEMQDSATVRSLSFIIERLRSREMMSILENHAASLEAECISCTVPKTEGRSQNA